MLPVGRDEDVAVTDAQTIVASIKAAEGNGFRYPLTIRFVKP